MKKVSFTIYFCGGPWYGTFTPEIMIAKPCNTSTFGFDVQALIQEGIAGIGDLTEYVKKDPTLRESLGDWGLQNLSWETVYIPKENYLLSLQADKTFQELFDHFGQDTLELAHFYVGGGASIHNETDYRFTIHPDEKIHRNLPHVHVEKDGVEIRYSLQDFKPLDSLKQPHTRDYKKRIRPFLEQKRDLFLSLWQEYNDGYLPPLFTESGQQFYPES